VPCWPSASAPCRWPSYAASSQALRTSPPCPLWGTGALHSLSRAGWWEPPSSEAVKSSCPLQERKPATGELAPCLLLVLLTPCIFHSPQWERSVRDAITKKPQLLLTRSNTKAWIWHMTFVIIIFSVEVIFLAKFLWRRNRHGRVKM
jgi:hypothetical protein